MCISDITCTQCSDFHKWDILGQTHVMGIRISRYQRGINFNFKLEFISQALSSAHNHPGSQQICFRQSSQGKKRCLLQDPTWRIPVSHLPPTVLLLHCDISWLEAHEYFQNWCIHKWTCKSTVRHWRVSTFLLDWLFNNLFHKQLNYRITSGADCGHHMTTASFHRCMEMQWWDLQQSVSRVISRFPAKTLITFIKAITIKNENSLLNIWICHWNCIKPYLSLIYERVIYKSNISPSPKMEKCFYFRDKGYGKYLEIEPIKISPEM